MFNRQKDFCISFHFGKKNLLSFILINSIDPDDLCFDEDGKHSGIVRGARFEDYREVIHHCKKLISVGIVGDQEQLVNSIKEIQQLFKEM